MRLQVTLALICVLSPQALALNCLRCIPDTSETCKETVTSCSDQCASITTFTSTGGLPQELKLKECVPAKECVSGSLNLGLVKTTINTKCCKTNLCNNESVPALPFGAPNGKKCYTCTTNDCTGTLNCEGDEDGCVSAIATDGATKVPVKGCVSRSLCTSSRSNVRAAGFTDVSCCSGNMCNSAAGVKMSLLIMLVPLLSSFFL